MNERIGEEEGRTLFGADPVAYHEARPPYPEELYGFLRETGALRADVSTLEIGAGSGLATHRLLALGANPLTVVEPDPRFASMLTSLARRSRAEVRCLIGSFEEAELPSRHYDLVAAASSFHWIRPSVGLARVASLLKHGGYAALWWHVFGDPDRDDPFHEATRAILEPLASSPSGRPDAVPFALDTASRLGDFSRTGEFEPAASRAYRWRLVLDAARVGALYATFSPIARLPEDRRKAVLGQLMEVADGRFRGTVTRNMVTPIYVARRKLT